MFAFKKSAAALAVAACVGFSSIAIAASNTQGGLVGKATDINGSPITQATITIKNTETGLTRTVESEADGSYRFPLLPPGTYEVSAHKDKVGDSSSVQVAVRIGQNSAVDLAMTNSSLEVIEITGRNIAMVDVTTSESVMVIDSVTLERLPVARDLASVAMLAPGVNQGDSAFEGDGKLASFSGASVGENAYYINGLNTTNFRNGLGGSQVPFEFYEQFEVKSGGYGAEYGRSTGGVVTAITKSGGNDFKFGASAFYEPDLFRADKPDVYTADGELAQINSYDKADNYDLNLYASGALIKDELFYYVLLNPSKQKSQYNSSVLGSSAFYEREQQAFFWGLNVDWYINEDNIVELTAFSDERADDVITSTWDYESHGIYASKPSEENRGGLNLALKYTSIISDDLQVSVLAGLNKYDRTDSSDFDAACPWIVDDRDVTTNLGCWATSNAVTADDERKSFRIDVDYALGDDHQLRFGVDVEQNTINNIENYSGGRYYRYYTAEEGAFNGLLQAGAQYYRMLERSSNGSFETDTSALYIEDTWQATDELVLTLGLRNETFDNKNIAGESFIKVSNQWAPRIGASWDVNGEGETKVFAHYGKYYLPVAANTNLRLAGAELYTRRYFILDGIDENGLPTNDYYSELTGTTTTHPDQLSNTTVYDDGVVGDTSSLVDANIKPMYQQEYILGVQHQLSDDWVVGVRATYRDLATSIEDIAIDAGLQRYADENYDGVDLELGGFDYYVLTNPGNDMVISVDANGDGELEQITLTAEQLGYPEAKRQYASVDFTFEKAWDGLWMLQGSYTWSHSWGNSEGAVRSDNGQDDAGLTTNFDQPGLTNGANGNLPNDRRHQFKLFGGYAVTEELTVGASFNWQTGRPRNAFGYHPTDIFAQDYGSESFFHNGQLVPRGSLGNQTSYWQLDLNAKLNTEINGIPVTFGIDVFNVFNNDRVRQTYEIADSEDSGEFEGVGTHPTDPYYGLAENHQTPRYVRLSGSVKF